MRYAAAVRVTARRHSRAAAAAAARAPAGSSPAPISPGALRPQPRGPGPRGARALCRRRRTTAMPRAAHRDGTMQTNILLLRKKLCFHFQCKAGERGEPAVLTLLYMTTPWFNVMVIQVEYHTNLDTSAGVGAAAARAAQPCGSVVCVCVVCAGERGRGDVPEGARCAASRRLLRGGRRSRVGEQMVRA